MAMESWKDKWTSILSKLDTCVTECRACIRSNQKCKDSIEAVMADVWSLKDWLESDPAVAISRADLNAFVTTPEAFNIRGCADINTRDKHHTVLNKHRDNTRLQNEDGGVADDGYPVVFSATRNYGAATLITGLMRSNSR